MDDPASTPATNHVRRFSSRRLSQQLVVLIRSRLWLQVIVGMICGLLVGYLLGPTFGWIEQDVATSLGNWLAFPGRLFLVLVQMIVIPLVLASIVRGLAAGENLEQLRRLGLRVVLFFVATTAVATSIGLGLASWIAPGDSLDTSLLAIAPTAVPDTEVDAGLHLGELPERVIGLLPGNPLSSMVEGQMLQVVIFSIIVGIALVTMEKSTSRPLLELLGSIQEICMTVVRWAMHLAPFAVFGLMAQLTLRTGPGVLSAMAVYVFTVLLGLVLMLLFYLALLRLLTGISPRQFLSQTRDVLLLAFSTSSSAAVMPLSIRTCEERLGVSPHIAQFVIPLGATINMSGTALYQGVATMFLAQVYGIDLGTAGVLLVVLMAVGASIGSPATPGVGIVILSMVLESVSVPVSGIALIIGVDRILDMARTTVNVSGDLVTSTLMQRWSGRSPLSVSAVAGSANP